MPVSKELPNKSWPAEEETILAQWQKEKIFAKTLARKSRHGNFVFYEGPPTANAAPGVHHVIGRVFKDIIVRFRTMQGYHVVRKAGWDTHGLPVELQVEKKLGLKSKPEIETYGIAKFNAECKELVWKFKDEWEKLTERIGFWLDLKHPYITYENEYIESVWAVIAKAHERKLLYQGHKVVPFCTRCGTALSSHEVAQGYESVTEDSVYVKCRVTKGNQFVQPGDYILTWTTTPWTLPGNVALAVGPDITYVRVKRFTGEWDTNGKAIYDHVILAKAIFDDFKNDPVSLKSEPFHFSFSASGNRAIPDDPRITNEFNGSQLVGVEYSQLFVGAIDRGNAKVAWQVVPADFVTTTDGTGVVHTAVMYGEDDYQLGETVGLPKQHTVGLDGKFLPHVAGLAGKYVKAKETEAAIYEHLKKTGAFFRSAPYTHDYPFCWRCNTPLLYYAKDSWFIAMTKVKDELQQNAAQINWIPGHIKEGRFGEWLAHLKDWAISRERYWGTPLPVWRCQTGNSNFEFRISKIDSKLKIQNSKLTQACGRWQVVGSMAELKKMVGKIPKDLHRPFIDEVEWPCKECGGTMRRVPEVMDVWLDSGSMPFAQYHYPFENKKLIDGKSDVQYPADYISEAIDQTRGWFYTLLAVSTIMGKGTSYRNVICYGHVNDAKGQKMSKSKGNIVNPWDIINQFGIDPLRWYLYTINQPGEAKNFDPKQIDEIVKKVFLILQNVVSFYWLYASSGATPKAQPPREAEPWVSHVLDRWVIARLHQLTGQMTGALEQYGVIEAARPMAEFITDLSTWYVRRSRERFKAGDKDAIAALGYVLLQTSALLSPFTPFFSEWVYRQVGGKLASVHLEDWPAVKTVDPQVLDTMAQARAVVTAGLAQRMSAGLKVRQPLAAVSGPKLGDELETIVKEELNVLEYRFGKAVLLDTVITEALKIAGTARELIRAINAQRKAAGLTIHDTITVTYEGELDGVLANHRQEILLKTKAKLFVAGDADTPVEINGQTIKLKIKKIS